MMAPRNAPGTARLTCARLLALLPLLAAACDPAIVPPKLAGEIYDFRLPTNPPSVLRWPAGTTVRVHVEGGPQPRAATLEQAFETGARIWNERAFYNEYRIERASSLAEADVVLRWSDETPPVITASCTPSIARAVTTFCIETSENRLRIFPLLGDEVTSSVRMLVTIIGTETQPQIVERLVAHELGHVLGIGQHSLNAQDLMYAGDLQRAALSVRDAATIQILYHTQPDIVP